MKLKGQRQSPNVEDKRTETMSGSFASGSPFARAAGEAANKRDDAQNVSRGRSMGGPFKKALEGTERRGKVGLYVSERQRELRNNRLDSQISAAQANAGRKNKTQARPTMMDAAREVGRQVQDTVDGINKGREDRIKRK